MLYFGAASALFAFGPRAQALTANPLYYIAFAVVLAGRHYAAEHSRRGRRQMAEQHRRAGQPVAAERAADAAGAVSYWRFGPATHITAASLVPHWSLDNAVFWSACSSPSAPLRPRRPWATRFRIRGARFPGLCCWRLHSYRRLHRRDRRAARRAAQRRGRRPRWLRERHPQALRHLGLGWLLAPIALLVALNAVGGAAANLSSTARLPFVAGVDRYLPAAFGWIHPRYRTPWVAIGVYGAAGALRRAARPGGNHGSRSL